MKSKILLLLNLILVLSLVSCQQPAATTLAPGTTPVSTQDLGSPGAATSAKTPGSPQPGSTQSPSPALSPSAPAPRTLVICLGQEPSTLYLYAGASQAMWSVLEAVYDGPIDTRNFEYKAVILTQLPTLENGAAVIKPVDVQTGEVVVDANGDLVALADGVKILPSGCTNTSCAAAWDSKAPVKMDQLSLMFSLLPNLKWSDGAPLSAADSVYSYQLSADPKTPVSRTNVERTRSYKAVDAQTVQWLGVPGFFPRYYQTLFWHPLPQHAWSKYTAEQLLEADESTRHPLGWGPYIIDEWVDGDHLRLVKNPNYFRAGEGLPKFDTLVFRFLTLPADSHLQALLVGECDVVDQTAGLDEIAQAVREQEIAKKLVMFKGQGPDWEQVVFNIKPASMDEGSKTAQGDSARPDFFGDVRTRQAFATCMDRDTVIKKALLSMSSVPGAYLPPYHPLFASDITPSAYDPIAGGKLLDEVGWKDDDNKPATPRKAIKVTNVPDGTELVVTYATTEAPLRKAVAMILADSLAACGIQLKITYMEPGELYTSGPDGLVFGRKFDLAQLAWKAGFEPPCLLYLGSQIPSAANNWLGVNVTGYNNAEFDAACNAARQTRFDQDAEYRAQHLAAMQIFAKDLPAIPLYFRVKIAAARPDLCGFEMDVTARSNLWNLEKLDYGLGCTP